MKFRNAILPASIALILLPAAAARAKDAADDGWHYTVAAYVLFPNMKGETGIADLPNMPIDEDPGDIFDKLRMGAMLYLEAQDDRWTFSSDLLYMNLGVDFRDDEGLISFNGDIDVTQVGWELAAMRRLTSNFELGIGLTWNQIDLDVEATYSTPLGSTDIGGGREEDWIDPTIVMRGTWPIGDKWFFQARGNIGGFGVGSDLMWQAIAEVGYRPSEKWFTSFGYRVIDIDYENGSGPDRFMYDVRTFGPELKLGINF